MEVGFPIYNIATKLEEDILWLFYLSDICRIAICDENPPIWHLKQLCSAQMNHEIWKSHLTQVDS